MTSQSQPLAYVPPYSWIFWCVLLAVYLPEFALTMRSRPFAGGPTDRGSMRFIILAGWLAFAAAVVVSTRPKFSIVDHRTGWFILGIVVLLAGCVLRLYCFRALGPYFTGNVKVQANHPLIETGLYRLIRHPSYTGGMLMYLGIGLALTNWLSVAILAGMGAAAYAYRVRVEERLLGNSIGQRYLDYMRRTKRFIPFVL